MWLVHWEEAMFNILLTFSRDFGSFFENYNGEKSRFFFSLNKSFQVSKTFFKFSQPSNFFLTKYMQLFLIYDCSIDENQIYQTNNLIDCSLDLHNFLSNSIPYCRCNIVVILTTKNICRIKLACFHCQCHC